MSVYQAYNKMMIVVNVKKIDSALCENVTNRRES